MKPERAKYMVPDEFRRLLAAAKARGPQRERNHMLFALAGNLGLRVGEIVQLRVADFHFEQPSRPFLRVRTEKSNTVNDIAIELKLARAIRKYISGLGGSAIRRHFARSDEVKKRRSQLCLFPGARDAWKPMTIRAAQIAFKETVRAAGLDPLVSFHALRHYRAVQVWSMTKDPLAVKKFLRHKSLSSSSVYVHMGDEEEQKINQRVGSIL